MSDSNITYYNLLLSNIIIMYNMCYITLTLLNVRKCKINITVASTRFFLHEESALNDDN